MHDEDEDGRSCLEHNQLTIMVIPNEAKQANKTQNGNHIKTNGLSQRKEKKTPINGQIDLINGVKLVDGQEDHVPEDDGIVDTNHENDGKSKQSSDKKSSASSSPILAESSSASSEMEPVRSKPLTINIEINIVAWTLFFFAFILRLWRLDFPRNVV